MAREGHVVRLVSHDADGDWQFLDATTDEPGECVMLCLGCVFERDPTLAQIADLPRGWSAFRAEAGAPWERWEKEAEEAGSGGCGDSTERDAKAIADIEQYGLHILNVAGEGDEPPFSYSIGIGKSLGQPELIVIGLRADMAQWMINECYLLMQGGTRIEPGARVAGLLEGFECVIGEVAPERSREYMGWATWLYGGPNFRALQIVFPTTAGVFPWEPAASESFRRLQPLLNAAA